MINRIMGVLKLDANTFEEIEGDQNATMQAAIIVVIVALIAGLGSGLLAENFISGFLFAAISAIVGWLVWSAATYFVGTTLFAGKATMGEMLRVLGYAQAPQILSFIPCVGLITWIWSLAAGFIAVRQGLDLDNVKAFLTIVVGFILVLAINFVLGLIFGVAGMGIGALTGALGG